MDELFCNPHEIPIILFALVANGFRIVPVHDNFTGGLTITIHGSHFTAATVQTDNGNPHGSGTALQYGLYHRPFSDQRVPFFRRFDMICSHAPIPFVLKNKKKDILFVCYRSILFYILSVKNHLCRVRPVNDDSPAVSSADNGFVLTNI
jgi:hypothetical protein